MTDVIPPQTDPSSSTEIPQSTETTEPTETPTTDNTSTDNIPTNDTPTEIDLISQSADPSHLSELEKIKAAQAARRTRRTRHSTPPTLPSTFTPTPTSSQQPNDSGDIQSLQNQLSTLRLEMASLRRNHLTNLKKVTDERDMFASQLAREQAAGTKEGSQLDARKVSDMAVQLRAARTRNDDLEEENTALRDEVKQLTFRVQAGKTLSAANDGYERIVDELVTAKLKCAQLQEEKDDLLKINRELTQANAVLTEANGELEKSRSSWVVQCAELEKQRAEMEKKLKEMQNGMAENADTSYKGSDLQDIKLN